LDKKVFKDLEGMTKRYKKLAKKLKLTLTETLLVVISRELIILNEKTLKEELVLD